MVTSRTGRVAVAILAAVSVMVPTAVFAAHFTDTAGNTHADNIDWMETTGITSGCTATEYCPDDPVTRAQMATFMRRLAGQDDDVDPVVDAATVDGLDANALVRAEHATGISDVAGDGTVKSLTMDIPGRGILLIWANVDLRNNSTNDDVTCRIDLDGTTVNGSMVTVTADDTDGRETQCVSQVGVTRVLGTDDTTIDFVVAGAAGTTSLGSASLSALYVPFRGDGSRPALVLPPGF